MPFPSFPGSRERTLGTRLKYRSFSDGVFMIICGNLSFGCEVLGLVFAGYVPLTSQSPCRTIVHCAASYIPHLSCFWDNVIFATPSQSLSVISLIEVSYPKNPKMCWSCSSDGRATVFYFGGRVSKSYHPSQCFRPSSDKGQRFDRYRDLWH